MQITGAGLPVGDLGSGAVGALQWEGAREWVGTEQFKCWGAGGLELLELGVRVEPSERSDEQDTPLRLCLCL